MDPSAKSSCRSAKHGMSAFSAPFGPRRTFQHCSSWRYGQSRSRALIGGTGMTRLDSINLERTSCRLYSILMTLVRSA
jgi:hypothetical protein